MTRVLITGGFGFLARHVVAELRSLAPAPALTCADVCDEPALRRPGVSYRGGVDVRDERAVAAVREGQDVVLHLAGLVSFSHRDRERHFAVNQMGTRNVARACAATS